MESRQWTSSVAPSILFIGGVKGDRGSKVNGRYNLVGIDWGKPPVYKHSDAEYWLFLAVSGEWTVGLEQHMKSRAARGFLHSESVEPGLLPTSARIWKTGSGRSQKDAKVTEEGLVMKTVCAAPEPKRFKAETMGTLSAPPERREDFEDVAAAVVSHWLYQAELTPADGTECKQTLASFPCGEGAISFHVHRVVEDKALGFPIKFAIVSVALQGLFSALVIAFKGTSYLFDFLQWNLGHDYEAFGDRSSFVHAGAANAIRQLCFLMQGELHTLLEESIQRGVQHLVLTGHSLGGMYASAFLHRIYRDGMFSCFPTQGVRCVMFGAPMCFGRHPEKDPSEAYLSFKKFMQEQAVNYIHENDPAARAWSACDLPELVRAMVRGAKRDRGLVMGQVIHGAAETVLARDDFHAHFVRFANDFEHLARLRLLSRRGAKGLHWITDWDVSPDCLADHDCLTYVCRILDMFDAARPPIFVHDQAEVPSAVANGAEPQGPALGAEPQGPALGAEPREPTPAEVPEQDVPGMCVATAELCIWTWADAEVLPGMHGLAMLNPGRWSKELGRRELAEELEAQEQEGRPVRLRAAAARWRSSGDRVFEDARAAASWLKGA